MGFENQPNSADTDLTRKGIGLALFLVGFCLIIAAGFEVLFGEPIGANHIDYIAPAIFTLIGVVFCMWGIRIIVRMWKQNSRDKSEARGCDS